MGGFVAGFIPGGAGTAAGAGLDLYVSYWLQSTVAQLASTANKYCKAKEVGITVNIVPSSFGKDRAYVDIFQVGGEPPHDQIEQWAFDYDFTPPPGGYIPPSPPGYFTYRWKGGLTGRRRGAYYLPKWQGRISHREGYFSKALREVITPSYMSAFGAMVAGYVGQIVSYHLKQTYEAQGYQVVII